MGEKKDTTRKKAVFGKKEKERKKEAGGLSMPNFMHLYRETNVYKLVFWVKSVEGGHTLIWVHTEQSSCMSGLLASVVCSPLPLNMKLPSTQKH